jgi:hypothetical protein
VPEQMPSDLGSPSLSAAGLRWSAKILSAERPPVTDLGNTHSLVVVLWYSTSASIKLSGMGNVAAVCATRTTPRHR